MSLQNLQTALCGISKFIEKYSALGDAHMVDYFVHDHWNNILSHELREHLFSLSIEELHSLPRLLDVSNTEMEQVLRSLLSATSSFPLGLPLFLREIKDCLKPFSNFLTNISEVREIVKVNTENTMSTHTNLSVESKEYMCAEKSHDVSKMSPLVHLLCQHCLTDSVVDVGSGKGYLSTFLTLRYNLTVTGIEANESNSIGADVRAQKYLKYWLKHSINRSFKQDKHMVQEKESKFNSVVTHLNHDSDLNKLTNTKKFVMTGLHACGDLCPSIIASFLANPNSSAMCVVGCCYHLCTEYEPDQTKDFQGFPLSLLLKENGVKLGRNKRMVALQAPEKAASENSKELTKSELSLFYRAVLNAIMKEELLLDVESHDYQVGKVFSKSKSFTDYVRRCLKKLKINDQALTDEIILSYLSKYEERLKEMIAFTVIRQIYAPAIEALIVLDRYSYLVENFSTANLSHCFISDIFDPVISPRRYAIIAVRNL